MSAASKSKARALVRHREQVARALVAKAPLYWAHSGKACAGLGALPGLLGPEVTHTFDVHAAREHAEALVLYGRHAHPELPSTLDTVPMLTGHDEQHTLLGRRILAALEGQPSECQGGCCVMAAPAVLIDEEGNHVHVRKGQRVHIPGETEPRWSYQPGQVKLGCPACHGTGHNLRGELPPVEVTPQIRRRRADQGLDEHGARSTSDTWLDTDLGQWAPGWGLYRLRSFDGPRMHTRAQLEDGSNGTTTRTRSVPRGEHRDELGSSYDLPDAAPLDVVISSRGWSTWNFFVRKMPRWRRGELRHAEQRRAKQDSEA